MRVKTLKLTNYRNYETALAEFSPLLNVLVGQNAAGKTNMLESIYLAGLGRSPRTTKDKELVLENKEKANIKIEVEKKFRSHRIEIQIDNNSKKKIFLDGLPVLRVGELIGVLNVVYFSPDEMRLVKEAPENRRRFLDISLSQQQKAYFENLSRYNKVLKQRNNFLKFSKDEKMMDTMLDVWDEQLADYGSILIEKRIAFVDSLNEKAQKAHFKMSEGKEILHLSYETVFSDKDLKEMQNVENSIKEKLKSELLKAREKDKKLQYTTVGAHRDDIKIEINQKDVRKFASQGQQRTTALAMKIGETEMFFQETGEYPILILDDVLSELDEKRKNLLIESVENAQVLLSCTEYELDKNANILQIENGAVKQN